MDMKVPRDDLPEDSMLGTICCCCEWIQTRQGVSTSIQQHFTSILVFLELLWSLCDSDWFHTPMNWIGNFTWFDLCWPPDFGWPVSVDRWLWHRVHTMYATLTLMEYWCEFTCRYFQKFAGWGYRSPQGIYSKISVMESARGLQTHEWVIILDQVFILQLENYCLQKIHKTYLISCHMILWFLRLFENNKVMQAWFPK